MILVTGGTGLVGTHLLYDLTRSGKKVRALKRAGSNVSNVKKVFSYYTDDADELLKNIEWVDADLLDVYALMDAMTGVSYVYHSAAMVSFEPRHQAEMMKINIEGTANMVNAALEKGIKKFCHISSIATLGRAEQGKLIDEETFWKSSPELSNYAVSKYGAEREIWRAAEEGLNTVIVLPALIVGAGNWNQSSSNMFSKAYKGIKFYTNGINGFVDVRDVSALAIKLMESEISNQRFVLSAENTAFKDFFDQVHEALGKEKPKRKAGKMLSAIAWRADKLRCFFSGGTPLITKETIRSANRISRFSNKKIFTAFPDYKFIPIEQSIKDTSKLFLKDIKNK